MGRRIQISEWSLKGALKRAIGAANYYEAKPPGILGRYAFAPQRAGDGVPSEKNTREEELLHDDLVNYVKSYEWKSDGVQTTQLIDSILQSNMYNDVFKEPLYSGMELYRGMGLTRSALAEMIGLPPDGLSGVSLQPGKEWFRRFRFEPHKRRGASSWTSDPKVAQTFARTRFHEFKVVLVAEAGENPDKFLDMRYLYEPLGLKGFSKESEFLGIGTIQVNRIILVSWTKEIEDQL